MWFRTGPRRLLPQQNQLHPQSVGDEVFYSVSSQAPRTHTHTLLQVTSCFHILAHVMMRMIVSGSMTTSERPGTLSEEASWMRAFRHEGRPG